MTFYAINELIDADRRLKPGGEQYDRDAILLANLFGGTAQADIYGHLKALGLGDKFNKRPLDPSAMRHVIQSQSVVYARPADRRLVLDGDELEDDHPAMVLLGEVFDRCQYDAHWEVADQARNLYRTCALMFQESDPHESVQCRVFEPFNLRRKIDARAADTLEFDEVVAFQVHAGNSDADHVYELWLHEDDGSWRVHRIDGRGNQVGAQPYGETSGRPPYDGIPAVLVYDSPPMGQAYLPLVANRIAFALNSAGLFNDLAYLVKMEAHTKTAVTGSDLKGLPDEVGPGKTVVVEDPDAQFHNLAHSPKLDESGRRFDECLSAFATSEDLPPDAFKSSAGVVTGTALKVKERSKGRRARRQVALVRQTERRAYRALARVHNAFARQWGLGLLPEGADLVATPVLEQAYEDPKETQEVAFKDLAIGAISMIDYRMKVYGETRREAIRNHERVQADREAYPVAQQQNPAALADGGPHAATGREGAQKVDGAFNPEIETSTEGASVTDAVRAGQA